MQERSEVKKFSEFAELPKIFSGQKISIDELLNREIVILGFKTTESKFQKEGSDQYTTLHIRIKSSAEERVLFTGSKVIREQCLQYEDHIPFETVIKKTNKYYTFT